MSHFRSLYEFASLAKHDQRDPLLPLGTRINWFEAFYPSYDQIRESGEKWWNTTSYLVAGSQRVNQLGGEIFFAPNLVFVATKHVEMGFKKTFFPNRVG